MVRAKRRFLGAGIVGTVTLSAFLALPAFSNLKYPPPHSSRTAQEVLRKSMNRLFSVNIRAIITQRDPALDGGYQRVKIERAKDGRVHCVILQPLSVQGVESMDDGTRYRVFLPDQKMVIDQDSTLKIPCDADDRVVLAQRNYSLKFSDSHTIAGRPTWCVLANPKHDGLDTRKYFIDQQTFYPLRMETVGQEGEVRVNFDTKDIQYLDELSESTFVKSPVGAVTTIRYDRPPTFLSKAKAKSLMGFVPIVPTDLPMGFKLQEMQLNKTSQWKSLVIRLTDGLVKATVYQWIPSEDSGEVSSLEDSTTIDVRGLRLMLVSDIREPVRKQMLEAFIANAETENVWMRSLGNLTPSKGIFQDNSYEDLSKWELNPSPRLFTQKESTNLSK